MKTADIQKFLATDPGVQKIVRERVGQNDDGTWEGEAPEDAPDDPDAMSKWPEHAKNPKKWVREWKLAYGSKAWMDKQGHLCDPTFMKQHCGFDPAGSVVRRFWLRGTDHVSIEVWEKDGKIVLADDVSD